MNILITRPDERGQQLLEMLAAQHIFAIHQPLFRVEAGRELPLLPSVLANLKSGDYVFAVSRNAIDFAHQTLSNTGFHWRSDLCYFAVGPGSANYFSSQAEQAVRYPISLTTSEGLLSLPEMQNVQGKTVLILRAESGRELFAEQMQVRGATVKMLECYQRVALSDNIAEKMSLAKRAGIDTILVTSGEMLTMLLENTLEAEREWLFGCRLVVVSSRIAQEAQQLGWTLPNIVISEKADNQSLLQTIMKYQTS